MTARRSGPVLVLVCVLAALGGTACAEDNSIPEASVDELTDTIAAEIPGVEVTDIAATGDGFNYPHELDLRLVTDTTDVAAVRRQAREATRLAWLLADAGAARITVAVELPGRDGAEPDRIRVRVPTDAARRLWGDNERGDRSDNNNGETFEPIGPELPEGWQPEFGVAFEPDLTYGVFVPDGTSGATLSAGADRLAQFLWREHPDRLTSITIEATTRVQDGRDTSTAVRYPAEELRSRFGDRAPDLER